MSFCCLTLCLQLHNQMQMLKENLLIDDRHNNIIIITHTNYLLLHVPMNIVRVPDRSNLTGNVLLERLGNAKGRLRECKKLSVPS